MKTLKNILLPVALFFILPGYSQPADSQPNSPLDTLHPDEIPVDIPEKQGDSILKGKGGSTAPSKTFNSDDAKYLQEAYSTGLMELKLAEQAKTKSQKSEVKDLAAMMIAAHAKLNDQIQSVSSKNQVPLPSLSKEQKQKLQNLLKASAKEYDREFIDLIIAEHKVSIDLFEKAENHASDPQVKDLFSNALPELLKHTGMAMEVRKKLE